MRRSVMSLGIALLATLAPRPAPASGAWQTFLRASSFSGLIAEADTVLCATGEAGLLRFTPSTGTFSTTVREPNALASNRLGALAMDGSRRLWIGTRGAGVSVLSADRTSWSLVSAFDGLPSLTVNVLAAYGDSVWIGTQGGLALWDGSQISGVLPDGVNPSPFASNDITGVAEIGDSVWISTRAGVYVARRSQGFASWTARNAGLPSVDVGGLVTDGARPYALSSSIVHHFDTGTSTWVADGGIGTVVRVGSSRGVVTASTTSGIYRRNGAAWSAISGGPASSVAGPFLVAFDETGRAWAAGWPSPGRDPASDGLYRQPDAPGPWTLESAPGPPGNGCLNIEIAGDRLYLTTYAEGVGRLRDGVWTRWFPGSAGDTTSARLRRPRFNYGLISEPAGRTWIYSWAPTSFVVETCVPDTGSIDILDDTGPTDVVEHRVLGPAASEARRSWARGSTLDAFGGHWFGMDSPCGDNGDTGPAGLEYYRPDGSYGGNFSTANFPALRNDRIDALATDRNGRIWVGSNGGLVYFDWHSNDTTPVGARVSGTDPLAIRGLVVRSDSLWVLSTDDLRQYSLTGNNRGSYTVPGPPSGQSVRPMDVGLDGTLWLGTGSGVRAFHPGGRSEDFTAANSPLCDDDVRTIRVEPGTGAVWIATGSGLNRYDPGFVPTPTTLSSLSVSVFPNPGRLTALGAPIRLSGNGTSYQGAIYDLGGRLVHTFTSPSNGRVVWDGRDRDGDPVGPGIYFVRVEAGGRSGMVRLVLLR